MAGPSGCLSGQGRGGARPGTEVCGGSQGSRKTLASISIFRPGLLPPPPFPIPRSPTWLDSPSSLAGELEGGGSFQNVSVELQWEAWQLEIVSHLLGNRQPNNSRNGGGRGTLCRLAKRSRPSAPRKLQFFLTCVSQGPDGRQRPISQLRRELTIKNW